MGDIHRTQGPLRDKGLDAACQSRKHTESEWQDLCTATQQELLRRGCTWGRHEDTAAELLDTYSIKQSFRVKDYYRDGSTRPYQSLRWATGAGEWLEGYEHIARRLCDRWQAPQPQEIPTGQADHVRSEGGAQTQGGQPGAGAGGNVQQPVSTGQGSSKQGGEREHMEQKPKRRRTYGASTCEVNRIESVRKLFNKTVAALINFQRPRKQQVAKWVINAKVSQVEKRQYPSSGHSGETYVTFSDNRTVKGLIHAATKLAELADREAAQDPSFQWTAAQKDSPLYSVLHQVHPSLDGVMSAAEQASTPPQGQQAPDDAELHTIRTLKAKTEELRSRMDELKAELVAAQQERDALQAGLPDEEESARTMRTLKEEAEQAEATWKQKGQSAVDAEAAWNRVRQEAVDAEAAWNSIRQEVDGLEACRSQADAALAAKVAEVERLQAAKDTTERQLATARQDVLKFF